MKKSDNSHPDKKRIQRRDFLRNGGTSLLLGMNLRSPLEATSREAGTGTATVHGTHQKTTGATRSLTSPVGHYKPELLLLAPEKGEDLNTKSLISQFLELGVPFELDQDWHLPTSPPRDLSAYKACLFPETARDKYDKDLRAFERAGGFVPYMRYYPVRPGGEVSEPHGYIVRHGRDVYFFHMANLTLEGGLTPLDRDFARTLESRAVGSMLAEYRNFYFSKYGSRNFGPWDEWGDTAYTEFLTNYFLAETLKDREWLDLVNYCLEKAHEAAQEIIRGQLGKFRADVEMASIGFPMIGELMMSYGQKLNRNDIVQSGLGLVKLFVQHGHVVDGVITGTYMRYFWGETPMPGAGLYWAARIEGNRKYAAMADAMFQLTVKRNQRPDGIWRHWTDSRGHYGVAWSRGTYWPLLSMTQSFKAVEASTSSAAFLRQEAGKIFRGLGKFQDPDRGMWRLVIDEPTTRLESSASSGFVYCYDQLRSLNAVDQKYGAMIDGAFTGLKRFYYGGGIGSNCRGTSTGVGDYYRTRPMGWADKTLFAAGMALRRPDSVNRQ